MRGEEKAMGITRWDLLIGAAVLFAILVMFGPGVMAGFGLTF